MIRKPALLFGGLATLALAASLTSAQDKTRSISARGITFDVPASWKSDNLPAGSMRAAQLKVGPAEGDKEAAELAVFVFPGGAGTVEANIDRWQKQFVDEKGAPPKVESRTIKSNGSEVTIVECAGRYVAQVRPGSDQRVDKPNFRLLGAIVTTPEFGYFLKMTGPDKTMTEARPAFEALAKSIKLEK